MKNMLLRFNLLPPSFRQQFLFAQRVKRALLSLNIAVGLLGVLSLFLLFTLVYLQKQEEFFTEELARVKRNPQHLAIERIQNEIQRFNEQLRYLFLAPPSTDWASLLIELAKLAPEGVSLNALVVQGKVPNERVVLEGGAKTREQLIQFERALRSWAFAANVVSPLTNYQKPAQIAFQISFNLKSVNP
ncbi:MAG: hypothetical protein HY001_01265 [Candidatus Portnoybacteria bacterium]|nr:hypothetical protein [Candidatus Portnoybacteria bacterium]